MFFPSDLNMFIIIGYKIVYKCVNNFILFAIALLFAITIEFLINICQSHQSDSIHSCENMNGLH